jgi:hypothetical protein
MKKYYLAPAMFLLALLLIAGASPASAQRTEHYRLLTPAPGDVLRPGDQVEITWELKMDKTFTENEWAEMEFFMETGEGVHVRITPQMRVSARSFVWTVPNVSTKTARLVLQAGLEGSGDMFRFPMEGTFTIKGRRGDPSITLGALNREVKAGRNLDITWASNLPEGSSYDVMISYDRGAHFQKVGTTTGTRYDLPIGADFAGSITVQIVHTRGDGATIKSLQTRDATVTVGDLD